MQGPQVVRSVRRLMIGHRSLVLMEMCEKHEQQQDDDTLLKSIHGYLESRLLLLSSIQVRLGTR